MSGKSEVIFDRNVVEFVNPAPEREAQRGGAESDKHGQQRGLSKRLLQPGGVPRAVVVSQKRLHAHADAHLHHGDQHAGLAGRGHGRDRVGAVGGEELVREGGGKAAQQRADRVRNAQRQDLPQGFDIRQRALWIKGYAAVSPPE